MIYLKIFFLFIAIWWSLVNISKMYYKEVVPPGNILIQAFGITGFIVIQWLI